MRASAPTYDSSSATASGACSAVSAATASWIVFKRRTVSCPAGVDQHPCATSLRRPPLSWTTPYPQAAVPGSMPTTFTKGRYGPGRTNPVADEDDPAAKTAIRPRAQLRWVKEAGYENAIEHRSRIDSFSSDRHRRLGFPKDLYRRVQAGKWCRQCRRILGDGKQALQDHPVLRRIQGCLWSQGGLRPRHEDLYVEPIQSRSLYLESQEADVVSTG